MLVILLTVLLSDRAYADIPCEIDNAALQSMKPIEITLTRKDGTSYSMPAKLADTDSSRAAGFQRVCEATIEAMPILFEFEREVIPSFHMNNVVAPIDIAFIDKRGRIDSIQSMKPYSLVELKKTLYRPKGPVLYALEVHKGFYRQHELSLDSKMTWTRQDADTIDQ